MRSIIKKGRHYSFHLPKFHRNIKQFEINNIRFCNNAWYSRCEVKHSGINKLTGLGFGLTYHRDTIRDSIRIGWQPNFDKEGIIDIWVYWYQHDIRVYQKYRLGYVKVGETFDVKIEITSDSYIVLSTIHSQVDIPHPKLKNWGLVLYPYFGGKSKSPKDIIIEYDLIF